MEEKGAARYSLEYLSAYFHLPIAEAAKEIGVCTTVLKKVCRKNGIPRWPHRKIKSINKKIAELEASMGKSVDEDGRLEEEIKSLVEMREFIMKNPEAASAFKHLTKRGSNLPKKRFRRRRIENDEYVPVKPEYITPYYNYEDQGGDTDESVEQSYCDTPEPVPVVDGHYQPQYQPPFYFPPIDYNAARFFVHDPVGSFMMQPTTTQTTLPHPYPAIGVPAPTYNPEEW